MPDREPLAILVHRVNNLLAVIHTQVEVATARGTLDAATAALRTIQRSAEQTEQTVRDVRAGGNTAPPTDRG